MTKVVVVVVGVNGRRMAENRVVVSLNKRRQKRCSLKTDQG